MSAFEVLANELRKRPMSTYSTKKFMSRFERSTVASTNTISFNTNGTLLHSSASTIASSTTQPHNSLHQPTTLTGPLNSNLHQIIIGHLRNTPDTTSIYQTKATDTLSGYSTASSAPIHQNQNLAYIPNGLTIFFSCNHNHISWIHDAIVIGITLMFIFFIGIVCWTCCGKMRVTSNGRSKKTLRSASKEASETTICESSRESPVNVNLYRSVEDNQFIYSETLLQLQENQTNAYTQLSQTHTDHRADLWIRSNLWYKASSIPDQLRPPNCICDQPVFSQYMWCCFNIP